MPTPVGTQMPMPYSSSANGAVFPYVLDFTVGSLFPSDAWTQAGYGQRVMASCIGGDTAGSPTDVLNVVRFLTLLLLPTDAGLFPVGRVLKVTIELGP